MAVVIRAMTAEDIPVADAICVAAFQNASYASELALYLRLQPDGWLLALSDGSPVGTVGAVEYDNFAYIGLMAVHPDAQHQGIGRALMERLLDQLRARGCPMALLDASNAGWPLYTSLGFVVDDTASVFTGGSIADGARADFSDIHIVPIHPNELPALAAFDTPRFGADRSNVLAALLADLPDRAFLARAAAGEIVGFLYAQPRRIGPWVAATPDAAEALLARALALPFEGGPVALAPTANTDAAPLLARYGFVEQRRLRHMRLWGTPSLTRRTHIFGLASFTIG